ncbi:cupin [Aquabacterium olei]|uniref:Cupin n=1 Tax=Aquabacterium olei TaxID=1296669 RepID=A0A2U8FRL1_9BURK|nr:cupin domain-containing protein [Aquabacterium olei]AWI53705.1 cupin [Aquabacterium olei]
MTLPGNLFDDAQPPAEGERFDVLLAQRNLVIERIVSSDVITPTTYTQPQDEWVVVLEGEARLSVAGTPHTLRRGDHLFLPAGVPHTVEHTVNGTVWLAVHLQP